MDKSVVVGKNRKALQPLEIPYTEMINHKKALFVLLTMILGKTTRNPFDTRHFSSTDVHEEEELL